MQKKKKKPGMNQSTGETQHNWNGGFAALFCVIGNLHILIE